MEKEPRIEKLSRNGKKFYFGSQIWNATWEPTGPKPNWRVKEEPGSQKETTKTGKTQKKWKPTLEVDIKGPLVEDIFFLKEDAQEPPKQETRVRQRPRKPERQETIIHKLQEEEAVKPGVKPRKTGVALEKKTTSKPIITPRTVFALGPDNGLKTVQKVLPMADAKAVTNPQALLVGVVEEKVRLSSEAKRIALAAAELYINKKTEKIRFSAKDPLEALEMKKFLRIFHPDSQIPDSAIEIVEKPEGLNNEESIKQAVKAIEGETEFLVLRNQVARAELVSDISGENNLVSAAEDILQYRVRRKKEEMLYEMNVNYLRLNSDYTWSLRNWWSYIKEWQKKVRLDTRMNKTEISFSRASKWIKRGIKHIRL